MKDLNLDVFKVLDIGIITSFYISTFIYNRELTINQLGKDSSLFLISFQFFAEIKVKESTNPNDKNINKQISYIEDELVNRLLLKLYNYKVPEVDLDEKEKAKNDSDYDYSENSSFHEDENEVVDKDLLLFNNLSNEFSEKKFETERLAPIKKSIDLRKIPTIFNLNSSSNEATSKTFIKKKFSWMPFTSIKLFTQPRVLIVEDNRYGRLNIKDSIRKLDGDFIIDTAEDGEEATRKFSSLLNKGPIS